MLNFKIPITILDEKDSLVSKSPTRTASVKSGRIPRNKSQPTFEKNGGAIPQIGSVPNFERKLSKIDMVNQMKVKKCLSYFLLRKYS